VSGSETDLEHRGEVGDVRVVGGREIGRAETGLRAVAGFRATPPHPAVKERGSPQGIGSGVDAGPAIRRRDVAPGGAGATAKFSSTTRRTDTKRACRWRSRRSSTDRSASGTPANLLQSAATASVKGWR
jgi:hypothetical protein